MRVLRRHEGAGTEFDRIWGKLGWFSGSVFANSVLGVIAWGSRFQNQIIYYQASARGTGIIDQEKYALLTSANRWYASFYFIYPVEFLFLIIPTLMLLRRLSNHAMRSYNSQDWDMDGHVGTCSCIGEYALEKLHRVIAVVAVVCSLLGMLAMQVAAGYLVHQSKLYEQAAAACDDQGNASNLTKILINEAKTIRIVDKKARSVSFTFYAVVLVIMCAAYLVFIPFCVSIFRRAERRLGRDLGEIEHKADNVPVLVPAEYHSREVGATAGRKVRMRSDKAKEVIGMTLAAVIAQRRRFVAACGFVLATFILRASLGFLQAYAYSDGLPNPDCATCGPCQTEAALVLKWLDYTPEFEAIVVALSSPLPLVISLWLMMTKEERAQLMSRSSRDDLCLDEVTKRSKVARQSLAIDLQ